jgi:3-hydroxybutyryl-CoA dehydrogenase
LLEAWNKTAIIVKDTPGFIVNRIARPYYGEALRICEEAYANIATIDWAMKEMGGFRMGPFELMDYIGNDINYTVTETIFRQLYFDPRYRPSITQKRLVEARLFGRKTGRGFYDYHNPENNPEPLKDESMGETIFMRILVMLINEAIDALFHHIASKEDIELAMVKGVSYPKGLLSWADELGLDNVLARLEELQSDYGEDRYRPSPLLKRMVREGSTFFESTSGV